MTKEKTLELLLKIRLNLGRINIQLENAHLSYKVRPRSIIEELLVYICKFEDTKLRPRI